MICWEKKRVSAWYSLGVQAEWAPGPGESPSWRRLLAVSTPGHSYGQDPQDCGNYLERKHWYCVCHVDVRLVGLDPVTLQKGKHPSLWIWHGGSVRSERILYFCTPNIKGCTKGSDLFGICCVSVWVMKECPTPWWSLKYQFFDSSVSHKREKNSQCLLQSCSIYWLFLKRFKVGAYECFFKCLMVWQFR